MLCYRVDFDRFDVTFFQMYHQNIFKNTKKGDFNAIGIREQ